MKELDRDDHWLVATLCNESDRQISLACKELNIHNRARDESLLQLYTRIVSLFSEQGYQAVINQSQEDNRNHHNLLFLQEATSAVLNHRPTYTSGAIMRFLEKMMINDNSRSITLDDYLKRIPPAYHPLFEKMFIMDTWFQRGRITNELNELNTLLALL